MKPNYNRFYIKYSYLAPIIFARDIILASSPARRISLLNRLRDYVGLRNNADLFKLHGEINHCLSVFSESWSSYDYGEGYFYQSFDAVGISGLRDARARIKEMNIRDLVADKSVIDIGCNSGFISLAVADAARKIIGFDIHPGLINVGILVQRYLKLNNVQLIVSSFEDFVVREPVDVVLSLANHSTYDGNTKQSIRDYFSACRCSLKPGGSMLFESHHPQYENKASLEMACEVMKDFFTIRERRNLRHGTFFDRGRTFIVAERK